MNKPKLMIMGYGEHGKDHCCRILSEIFGLTAVSSSYFALEHIVYPALSNAYADMNSCYADRHNHRQTWYELIKAYNTTDSTRMARDIYSQYNIYNGIRNVVEFEAIKEAGLFDYAIWIDGSDRKPSESTDSCTVTRNHADIIVNNNQPLYLTTQYLIYIMLELYPELKI